VQLYETPSAPPAELLALKDSHAPPNSLEEGALTTPCKKENLGCNASSSAVSPMHPFSHRQQIFNATKEKEPSCGKTLPLAYGGDPFSFKELAKSSSRNGSLLLTSQKARDCYLEKEAGRTKETLDGDALSCLESPKKRVASVGVKFPSERKGVGQETVPFAQQRDQRAKGILPKLVRSATGELRIE